MNDAPLPGPAGAGDDEDPLSAEDVALLGEAYSALMAALPAERNADAFIELGRAVHAGPHSAKRIVKRFGVREMREKLGEVARTLRATGHFAEASQADSLAQMIAVWERRVSPRKPPPRRSG